MKKEMDDYFNQLDSQWSKGLSIISSGKMKQCDNMTIMKFNNDNTIMNMIS